MGNWWVLAYLFLCWHLSECELEEYDEYWYSCECQLGKFCVNLVNNASFAMFREFGENKLECVVHTKYVFSTLNDISYNYLSHLLHLLNLLRSFWNIAKLANTCKIKQSNICQTCLSCECFRMSNYLRKCFSLSDTEGAT